MLAAVRNRSRPFAQTACLQVFPLERMNATEPERTPTVAIVAILLVSGHQAPNPDSARSQARAGVGCRDRPERVAELVEEPPALPLVPVAWLAEPLRARPVVAVDIKDNVALDQVAPDAIANEPREGAEDVGARVRREPSRSSFSRCLPRSATPARSARADRRATAPRLARSRSRGR